MDIGKGGSLWSLHCPAIITLALHGCVHNEPHSTLAPHHQCLFVALRDHASSCGHAQEPVESLAVLCSFVDFPLLELPSAEPTLLGISGQISPGNAPALRPPPRSSRAQPGAPAPPTPAPRTCRVRTCHLSNWPHTQLSRPCLTRPVPTPCLPDPRAPLQSPSWELQPGPGGEQHLEDAPGGRR
ncbi:hypothetical protein P7K49_032651 [Saguinus oedipus]|uniref:Uncharacterized protein n=1 Tax=Saguinus oedipus TaxID=9490 RepID=A0ABQ9TZM2_SAGOE|nr:hypothetical protein P7K49_032651 [Saguinus oedipus]